MFYQIDFELIGRIFVTFCMVYTIADIALKATKRK